MANTLREKRFNFILYISIGSALAILILFIILFNVFSSIKKKSVKIGENTNNNVPQIEQANSQIGKNINEVEDETTSENLAIELSENENEEEEDLDDEDENEEQETTSENLVETPNTAETATTATENNENEEETPDPTFTMPVEGEIVKQYGKDKLIYSNTLKEWTTHLGIDIKANKTSVVKASSDGVVKAIKNDPRYGLTIILEHNKDFVTIYSNLLSSEFVTVGDQVKQGQAIGTVGNSATFEIVDEPHLHFEITKDGENIDPEMYIK
jgi:murein DD-endopeptidase MepM/ murein hydrolase activator NlpD